MDTTEERFFLWPVTKLPNGKYTLPDEMLHAAWNQLVLDGNAERVFYDGHVKTAEQFAEYLKAPGNYPVFVMDAKNRKAVFLAWLNGMAANTAFAHFTGLGGKYKPELSSMVADYWEKMNLFTVLLGVLPVFNANALKVATYGGFKILGTVPGLCLKADGSTADGIIVYRSMKKEGL